MERRLCSVACGLSGQQFQQHDPRCKRFLSQVFVAVSGIRHFRVVEIQTDKYMSELVIDEHPCLYSL